jgi:hypothetical protein
MSDRERLLREALRSARAADEPGAEERAWRVVSAAAATGARPAIGRGGRRRVAQAALVLALIAVLVSPAGASVRHWVADRIEPGAPHPRPVLSALPGDGSLLVDSVQGLWVVHPDGSKRLLGDWTEASWSPHGRFAVVTKGGELAAVTPTGEVRWAISRPGPVTKARWNGPDGFRIAYLEGRDLRVVNGDGGGDRRIAGGVAPVAPAWRPGPGHELAYVTERGALVMTVAVDSPRVRHGLTSGSRVVSLQWIGPRLLVARRDRLQVLDPGGRPLWTWAAPSGTTIDSATARGGRVAVVLRSGGSSRLLLVGRERASRTLFVGPGRLGPVSWSPEGDWLLAPWPRANQWLFLQPGAAAGKLHAVANVAAQFSPGDAKGARFPAVAGWNRSP